MKIISVSKLKAHLSAELAKVKKGAELVVTDHDMPIAEIRPYGKEMPFKITKATRKMSDLKINHDIRVNVDVVQYLLEDRQR